MIVIKGDLCDGCGICTEACPQEALSILKKKAVVNPGSCQECCTCIDVCPHGAMEIEDDKRG